MEKIRIKGNIERKVKSVELLTVRKLKLSAIS